MAPAWKGMRNRVSGWRYGEESGRASEIGHDTCALGDALLSLYSIKPAIFPNFPAARLFESLSRTSTAASPTTPRTPPPPPPAPAPSPPPATHARHRFRRLLVSVCLAPSGTVITGATKTDMEVDASFRLATMPPPSSTPFRALHPYQFAPAEYNPLMPSPDHPPNAPHPPPPLRADLPPPSDPHDRTHPQNAYYSHPPPPPAHASSSRAHYPSPPSPQFHTHAVHWGLPPISGSQQPPLPPQQPPPPLPPPSSLAGPSMPPGSFSPPPSGRRSTDDAQRAPQAALLYAQSQQLPPIQASALAPATRGRSSSLIASTFPQGANVPRLPPIMQVEKQQVTTSATQAASASRRRNEANFVCPVPGCGSTFTRRFNLRGMSAFRVMPSTAPPFNLSARVRLR